jgi:hypothetical protein
MTRNVTSTRVTELTKIKLTAVNFHKGDNMAYLRNQIARDACYTSQNSMNWKLEQMSKLKVEIAELHEASGSEVVDTKLAKRIDIYHSMEDELAELQIRHESDLQVHKTVTGEDWKATSRSFREKNAQAVLEAATAILAS